MAKAPIKVVAAGTSFDPATESTVKILVPKGSAITSVSQLAGKKVAIFEGTILQYTVLKSPPEGWTVVQRHHAGQPRPRRRRQRLPVR